MGNQDYETASELEDIMDEMKDLIQRAQNVLQGTDGLTRERARSYWIAHIRTALDNDHDYLGGSMVTMQDTIDELMGGK